MIKEKLYAAKGLTLNRWQRLQGPHKTAIVIFGLSVIWMSSIYVTDLFKAAEMAPKETVEVHVPRVRVTTILGEQHTQMIRVMGHTQADQAVNVRAQVLGHVLKVMVAKGDKVSIGDVLLLIDPEDRKGLLDESKARRKQRKIAYKAALKLSKGGYSSQLTVAKAKADLEAARAHVTRMQRNFDNGTVTAPLAGVIDTFPVKVGDYFDKAGGRIGRIVDLTKMVALGQVAERDIEDVALGKAATVRLPDGRILNGEVTYIASSSNALTRTFAVEVTLKISDGSVREGITAEIKLPMNTVFAHRISPALLALNDKGEIGVKTVNTDNIVEFHKVKVVSDTQNGMWLSGLSPQVRVISVGQGFVNIGQTVEAIEGKLNSMISQPRSGS